MPGPVQICPWTHSHLRRDSPTSEPGQHIPPASIRTLLHGSWTAPSLPSLAAAAETGVEGDTCTQNYNALLSLSWLQRFADTVCAFRSPIPLVWPIGSGSVRTARQTVANLTRGRARAVLACSRDVSPVHAHTHARIIDRKPERLSGVSGKLNTRGTRHVCAVCYVCVVCHV